MANIVKLNYTADEINERLGLVKEVNANPELDGSEEPLTGLEIGDTKYSMPSGGQKYVYEIALHYLGNTLYSAYLGFKFYFTADTPDLNFTNAATVKNYIVNNSIQTITPIQPIIYNKNLYFVSKVYSSGNCWMQKISYNAETQEYSIGSIENLDLSECTLQYITVIPF